MSIPAFKPARWTVIRPYSPRGVGHLRGWLALSPQGVGYYRATWAEAFALAAREADADAQRVYRAWSAAA